jgi:putative endonuclease
MLKSVSSVSKRTYVGYTKDLDKRLSLHNSNKGAKFTKGNKWKVIFKKRFILKSNAMSYEYILKNDKKTREEILTVYPT